MVGLHTFWLIVASLICLYLYVEARRLRFHQHEGLPRPKTSLIWGHMKVIHEFYQKGDLRRHIDYVFVAIAKALGSPEMMILDIRPVSYTICVILSHDLAEQVSRASKLFPWSTPKSPTLAELESFVGKLSIVTAQGERWKHIRKRYNPGFAPSYLIKLLSPIIDKTFIFLERLDKLARAGSEFTLDTLCTELTFDIIGAVSMEIDLGAQFPIDKQSDLVRLFRETLKTFTDTDGAGYLWLNPTMFFRRKRLSRQVDIAVKKAVREKYAELRASKASGKNRSVLALALQDIEAETLPPHVLQETADSLKSFLFAGFDTTSSTLLWAFTELSRSPRILSKLRAEHDEVFGTDADPAVVKRVLLNHGEEAISRMTYTSAVIKEILRLYPPAGTARRAPYGSGFFLKLKDGREICADGMVLYNCHYGIHRDPEVYGKTNNDFVPERWLGNVNTSAALDDDEGVETTAEKPPLTHAPTTKAAQASWRPFETGPRNCIGQELANLEARVILAFAVRRYDFTKIGLGEVLLDKKSQPILNDKGQYEVTEELFNTRQITAKPVDFTRMQVELRKT